MHGRPLQRRVIGGLEHSTEIFTRERWKLRNSSFCFTKWTPTTINFRKSVRSTSLIHHSEYFVHRIWIVCDSQSLNHSSSSHPRTRSFAMIIQTLTKIHVRVLCRFLVEILCTFCLSLPLSTQSHDLSGVRCR